MVCTKGLTCFSNLRNMVCTKGLTVLRKLNKFT